MEKRFREEEKKKKEKEKKNRKGKKGVDLKENKKGKTKQLTRCGELSLLLLVS